MRAIVVDDSRAVRMLLRRTLATAGYEVAEAGDGAQALDLLAAGPLPDVALVDWNMPVMDGLELVRAVRREAAWDRVRLVMVTTEGEVSHVLAALEAGAQEYLFKPFTPDAVLGKLALVGLPSGD